MDLPKQGCHGHQHFNISKKKICIFIKYALTTLIALYTCKAVAIVAKLNFIRDRIMYTEPLKSHSLENTCVD